MVIAVVGALAIVATTLGVVLYDEISGNEELTFELVTDEGFYAGGTDAPVAGGGPARQFSFAVPDNATSADFSVTVTFRGNSGEGGTAVVSAYFVDPTGNQSNTDQKNLVIPMNSDGATPSVTLKLAGTWAQAPNATETTDADAAAAEATTSYEGKLITVHVTIGAVNDRLVGVVPGLNYSYDIEITGDLTRYERHEELPDPSTV